MKPNTPVDEVYEAIERWQHNCIRTLLDNQTRSIGSAEFKEATYTIPQIEDITAVYVNEAMFRDLLQQDHTQRLVCFDYSGRGDYRLFGKPCFIVQDTRHPRVRII